MKAILPLFVLLLSCLAAFAQTATFQADYINRFKDIAIREMERTGIPASIKLAQGILESDSGRSYLATAANNHFGIKCGGSWRGERVFRKDDDYDDAGRLIESCFRRYQSPSASYVAHSEFLLDPKKTFRYGFLFRLKPTDYKKWANGLKQAGYATNPRYPRLLIDLIERYELYRYDREPTQGPAIPEFSPVPPSLPQTTPPTEVANTERPTPINQEAGVYRNNDVKYFRPNGELTLEEIAEIVDVSVRRLIDYNEYLRKPSQSPSPGERIYIQKKRSNYRGKKTFHEVAAGETMAEISQLYGVQLDKLRTRNRIPAGQEPATGVKIKLRGGTVSQAVAVRSTTEPEPVPSLPEPGPSLAPVDSESEELDMDLSNPIDIQTTERPTTPPTQTNQPSPAPVPVRTSPQQEGKIIPSGQPAQPAPRTNPAPPPVVNPPVAQPTPPSPARPNTSPVRYHEVKKGDTLYNISQRYRISVETLQQLNGLGKNSIIKIGQRLKVSQ